MLALRRLRTIPLKLVRSNTTIATTQGSAAAIPPANDKAGASGNSQSATASNAELQSSDTKGRTRRGRLVTRRPDISLEKPREWKRPIAFGVLPAYDEALRYIMKDSSALKKEAEGLRTSIKKEEGNSDRDEVALEKLRAKLNVLEVQSEINIPEVRWKVANGMGECVCYWTLDSILQYYSRHDATRPQASGGTEMA